MDNISLVKKELVVAGEKGLSISELAKNTKLARQTISTILARFEGAGEVSVRVVGMAKLYSWVGEVDK